MNGAISSLDNFDAYSPSQIAQLVENVGVHKATLPLLQTVTLAVLAGAFIIPALTYGLRAITYGLRALDRRK